MWSPETTPNSQWMSWMSMRDRWSASLMILIEVGSCMSSHIETAASEKEERGKTRASGWGGTEGTRRVLLIVVQWLAPHLILLCCTIHGE